MIIRPVFCFHQPTKSSNKSAHSFQFVTTELNLFPNPVIILSKLCDKSQHLSIWVLHWMLTLCKTLLFWWLPLFPLFNVNVLIWNKCVSSSSLLLCSSYMNGAIISLHSLLTYSYIHKDEDEDVWVRSVWLSGLKRSLVRKMQTQVLLSIDLSNAAS